ncbi:MAG: type II toxin-antitoxin system death-on-curing family toxin [Spirobacillus cienkowskii]|jgi:death-on-curing family protein|uniref:Type II toxin-antitoxin system death-on-curing family toxin n=1 Tax=Spirobacillus cienkowskii TaxID=495820 RepID=A0A369KMG7_9BACT|nr:MAG: type II toxin-antitoxin system death-on-curing family toxin [Spirobacillus cienkowskii]
MKIKKIKTDFVLEINKKVTFSFGQKHICAHPEKIESALYAAIYPGQFPFVHGGIVDVAAAMFFYIIKAHAFFDGNKRTALICSLIFLESNGWSLKYPISEKSNKFAELAEDCASNVKNIDEIKKWFKNHKVRIIF